MHIRSAMTHVFRLFFSKVGLGKLAVPVWLALPAGVLLVVAAGQAVGPVLPGFASGIAGLTVEQTIVISGVKLRDYPPTLLYSVSPRDNQLRVIDSSGPVVTESSVTIGPKVNGLTVEGANGLAADSTDSDKLYALLKLTGQAGRQLATLDPDTGAVTSIGNTGDRFAGLAFASDGTLFAVTGDGAGVPETLYTLSKTTGAATFKKTLGTGNDGEALSFNPDDGLLYHASGEGVPNVNEIFETIDPTSLAVTSVTLKGLDYAEATALGYEGDSNFFLADLGRRLYRINTEGFSELVGIIDHDAKGLVPFGLAHVDDSVALINDEGTSFTVAVEPHVGDDFMIILELENESDADANVRLDLEVPKGIRTEAQFIGAIEGAQFARDVWMLKVPKTLTDSEVRIIIKSEDDSAPDFYTLKARIVQIAG